MSKSVVVLPLGRFQPPHKEHKNLVDAVLKLAKQTHSDAKIFVSRTVDKKKNPLTPQEKIKYLNKMFPGHKGLFDMPPVSTPTMIGSLAELSGKYDTVHIVLGDDRVDATETLVNKYNGKDFTFEKIVVHSRHSIINTRVGDADGVHASDIRKWAQEGDFDKVRAEMPENMSDADVKGIMRLIQTRLGKKEMKEEVNPLDEVFAQLMFEEADETDLEITLPSDAEIKKQLDRMSNDELDMQDDDWMVADIIAGPEAWDEKVDTHEAVSIQNRQKRSQRFKAMSKRLAKMRQIKSKQMPQGQRLRMRARKAALMMLRARATGKKNLDYASLSRGQKIAVDNALMQRFGKRLKNTVDAYAKRILPRIRSKAQDSVKKARDMKESYVNEIFSQSIFSDKKKSKEDTPQDKATDKIQAAQRGLSVKDWEKSKADKAHDSPLNVDGQKLNTLDTDPSLNDRVAPNPKQGHLNVNIKKTHSYGKALDDSYNPAIEEGRKSASDKDARDAGDTNIIYQMRKTINSRGEHETVFADGHKTHISINDAKKLLAKFEALRLPADKHKFTIAAGASAKSFHNVMAHGIPKDKPKISLGGKSFREFYTAGGNTRAVSPYDKDEPPGIRNIGEVAKDEDRPTDPNQSRPLSQKMDLLLRLGLVDQEELQKYRRALRSSKKFALQSPQMREKLADLLDKLIDLTTKDAPTYSRVRYNVTTKEAVSLMRKAEKSGVDIEIIQEVFIRGLEEDADVGKAFARVNSFIAGGFAAKLDEDCWKGYKAIGIKKKNGKTVPNCVPKEETNNESYTGSEPVSKDKNDPKNRFVGTDTIVQNYASVTPGQKISNAEQSKMNLNNIRKALGGIREAYDLNESFSAGFELAPFAKDYGIKVRSAFEHHPDVQEQLDAMEATYQGKSVPLNKPMKGDVKKSKVYVDPDGDGKAKKVNFGDKHLSIKKDQPANKKSYCPRSGGQGNLTNKSSANYWSRRAWDC